MLLPLRAGSTMSGEGPPRSKPTSEGKRGNLFLPKALNVNVSEELSHELIADIHDIIQCLYLHRS